MSRCTVWEVSGKKCHVKRFGGGGGGGSSLDTPQTVQRDTFSLTPPPPKTVFHPPHAPTLGGVPCAKSQGKVWSGQPHQGVCGSGVTCGWCVWVVCVGGVCGWCDVLALNPMCGWCVPVGGVCTDNWMCVWVTVVSCGNKIRCVCEAECVCESQTGDVWVNVSCGWCCVWPG